MGNRAVCFGKFGLENLEIVEVPVREPGHGEVRLRVEAVSLNRRDLLLVEGKYNPKQKLPSVPCSDAAGHIEAVGPGCSRFRPGDRAVLHFFTGWLAGEPDSDKLLTALGGPGGDGTLQDTIIVPEYALVPLPEAIDVETAACLPCAALTAWSAIVELGGVKAGDTVLIQGTGGVSLFALQFARMQGARVIASTSSPEREARLKALGAHETINYVANPDWGNTARKIAEGRLDLVVEVGGATTLESSLRAIRPGGTIALVGVLTGTHAPVNLSLSVMRQVRMQGITVGSRETFEAMLRAIRLNGIEPVIDGIYTLDEAPKAFARMAANGHVGKILIRL